MDFGDAVKAAVGGAAAVVLVVAVMGAYRALTSAGLRALAPQLAAGIVGAGLAALATMLVSGLSDARLMAAVMRSPLDYLAVPAAIGGAVAIAMSLWAARR